MISQEQIDNKFIGLQEIDSGDVRKLIKHKKHKSESFSDGPDEQIERAEQFEGSSSPGSLQLLKLGELSRGRVSTDELIIKVKDVREFIESTSTKEKSLSLNMLKHLVSKQKCRYVLDGFDLDLSYITPNIIAMGFPATDFQQVFRNSMKDIQKFFNQRHPNHYKIYNLCAERKYPLNLFQQAEEWGFYDHQPPPFKMLYPFCQSVEKFLKQDEQNVVGIHCKAGKGRTGLMICIYLLYSKFLETSNDVQRYYGLIRTKNRKGITIPSQIRYLDYFYWSLQMSNPKQVIYLDLSITQISMYTIPNFNALGGCNPWFRITCGNQEFISQPFGNQKYSQGVLVMKPQEVHVIGDLLIEFFNSSFTNKQEKMFQLWLNTGFTQPGQRLVFQKKDLDKAVSDKQNKHFAENFRLEVQFEAAPQIRRRSHIILSKPEQLQQKPLINQEINPIEIPNNDGIVKNISVSVVSQDSIPQEELYGPYTQVYQIQKEVSTTMIVYHSKRSYI